MSANHELEVEAALIIGMPTFLVFGGLSALYSLKSSHKRLRFLPVLLFFAPVLVGLATKPVMGPGPESWFLPAGFVIWGFVTLLSSIIFLRGQKGSLALALRAAMGMTGAIFAVLGTLALANSDLFI